MHVFPGGRADPELTTGAATFFRVPFGVVDTSLPDQRIVCHDRANSHGLPELRQYSEDGSADLGTPL